MGEVPTLVHGDFVLAQSMAILFYLDKVFPQPSLFPAVPQQFGRVIQFCENINAGIHPVANLKITQHLEKELGISAEQKNQWQHHWISKGLDACEKLATTKVTGQNSMPRYLFGDDITAAEVLLIPQIFSAQRFGVDLSKCPRLMEINEECLKREEFKKAHPSQQPDFE